MDGKGGVGKKRRKETIGEIGGRIFQVRREKVMGGENE